MDSCLFSKTFLEYIFHHSAYYDRQFLIVRVFILSILLCFPPLFKDPKGDESRMLSLWLSGCPKERVWQESSEWHYLLFVCCLFALSPPPEVVVYPAPQDLKSWELSVSSSSSPGLLHIAV